MQFWTLRKILKKGHSTHICKDTTASTIEIPHKRSQEKQSGRIRAHQNTSVSRNDTPTSEAPTTTMRALMVTLNRRKKHGNNKVSRLSSLLSFLFHYWVKTSDQWWWETALNISLTLLTNTGSPKNGTRWCTPYLRIYLEIISSGTLLWDHS